MDGRKDGNIVPCFETKKQQKSTNYIVILCNFFNVAIAFMYRKLSSVHLAQFSW